MMELILDILFVLGAWVVIAVLAAVVFALAAVADKSGPERARYRTRGDVLTGCHLDGRREMVSRPASAEEISASARKDIDLNTISHERTN